MPSILKAAWITSLCLAGAGQAGATPVVSVSSGGGSVGGSFTIPVLITGADQLGAWQFDILYDPQLLKVTAVTEGSFLNVQGPTLFSPGVADDNAGSVTLVTNAFAGLPPAPSGAGVLANIEFLALGIGSSSLALANVFLNFADTGFDTVEGLARGVPEPGSAALLLTALAASLLAGCHNRRRQAVSASTF